MHLRRSARLWLSLVLAVLLSACVPSNGHRPGERDTPARGTTNAEAPSRSAGAPQEDQNANAASASRAEASMHRGTGVFVNADAVARQEAATEGAGEITLNFANADIREVVRTILGDTLGLNYAIDPAVQDSITMQTSQPLPRSAVLPALESVLQLNGATIVEARGLYRVVPVEGRIASTARPLIGLSIDEPATSFGVRIVPLRYISAGEMQRILEPFLPSGGVLEVDAERNLLILGAAGQQLETLLTLVDIFDVDFLKGRSFALVPLDFAAAGRCSGPQLRDTALLIHAAAGSGASCAALMAAGVW
jgi:general secretion pathway protein D